MKIFTTLVRNIGVTGLVLLPLTSLAADPAAVARKATWLLEMSRGVASGFLVQIASKYQLFTAHHVAGAKYSCGPGALQSRMGELGKEKRKFSFVASPETCNFPYDTASVTTNPGTALELVSKDEMPVIGERVVITGYPLSRDSKQTQHTCTLRGFDLLNDHGEGETDLAAYSLKCDGVAYDLGGISGGSAVSLRTGKAIGVFTGQQEGSEDSYLPFVVVSPLYLDGDRVRNGYPKDLPNTQCYDSDSKGYSECEIKAGKIVY